MTILSTVSTFFTGISTEVYKWLAIVGVVTGIVVAAFLWGEHLGASSAVAKQLQQDVKSQQQVIVRQQIQTVVDTTAVTTLQKQLDGLTAQNLSLQARIKALTTQMILVPATPATPTAPAIPATCELSPQSIEIYNESIGVKSND